MKGGRKNLKKAAEEHSIAALQPGQTITQVLSLRGSNQIEVMDGKGDKSLALFPAKFQKSMWIKRGSFVVVDETGKEKALESGSKVACIVSQVLTYEQVRRLQKSPQWPEVFKSTTLEDSNVSNEMNTQQQEETKHDEMNTQQQEETKLDSSDDDDGLPPLEANMNRVKPQWLQSDVESNSGSETDS